ncbi:MAG: efflux RND transporter periplasmic adaptor subunit [Mariprofundaceae bacterium]
MKRFSLNKFNLKQLSVLFYSMMMVVLAGCSQQSSSINEPPVDTVVAHQEVVGLQDVPVGYLTSGHITSDHRVFISTRISGYIGKITVREGDRVKTGQLLVQIDPVNAKQKLIQAKADLSHAQTELQRYDSLLKAGAVTSQQADKVQLRYQLAASQLKQAKHQLSYAKVLSPVNGVVVDKRLSQGDLASPGMVILSIEDPSSLLVQTYVSEQFIGSIHAGDRVAVLISALKKQFEGSVRQVVQAADPVSHQFLVKIALPSAADIHPGMYAQTAFDTGVRSALFIPVDAMVSRAGLSGVYLKDASNIIHYRQLRLGQESAGRVEVLAGLHAGDVIVWGGDSELKSGMKVQP